MVFVDFNYALMTEGQTVDRVRLPGSELTVPLVIDRDIRLSLTDKARRALKVKVL